MGLVDLLNSTFFEDRRCFGNVGSLDMSEVSQSRFLSLTCSFHSLLTFRNLSNSVSFLFFFLSFKGWVCNVSFVRKLVEVAKKKRPEKRKEMIHWKLGGQSKKNHRVVCCFFNGGSLKKFLIKTFYFLVLELMFLQ